MREIVSNAVEVAPDKQGRILVPAWLKEAAALESSVLLNGNIDRVELWNPDVYRRAVSDASPAELERFSLQIFG